MYTAFPGSHFLIKWEWGVSLSQPSFLPSIPLSRWNLFQMIMKWNSWAAIFWSYFLWSPDTGHIVKHGPYLGDFAFFFCTQRDHVLDEGLRIPSYYLSVSDRPSELLWGWRGWRHCDHFAGNPQFSVQRHSPQVRANFYYCYMGVLPTVMRSNFLTWRRVQAWGYGPVGWTEKVRLTDGY